MDLVPIKLLRNGSNKRVLLNLKGETHTIDQTDFLESRINTNTRAKHLMAIEDASEIAKYYLQKEGLFEQIAKDIKIESGKNFSFRCRKTKNIRNAFTQNKNGQEYILLEHTYNNGSGHYGMVSVNHTKKRIGVYDSMGAHETTFNPAIHTLNKNNTYSHTSKSFGPQPTGGFVANTPNDDIFNRVPINKRKRVFQLSQYDEMSQHHFCYVESFVVMMKDIGLAHEGPLDPRLRLEFIKKVAWGLILKYVPKSRRTTPQWKYFETNFKYIMTTRAPNGKLLKMVDGIIQIPTTNGVKISIKELKLRNDIDHRWSLTQIMNWAGSKM
jgi:hypothetical protein